MSAIPVNTVSVVMMDRPTAGSSAPKATIRTGTARMATAIPDGTANVRIRETILRGDRMGGTHNARTRVGSPTVTRASTALFRGVKGNGTPRRAAVTMMSSM